MVIIIIIIIIKRGQKYNLSSPFDFQMLKKLYLELYCINSYAEKNTQIMFCGRFHRSSVVQIGSHA